MRALALIALAACGGDADRVYWLDELPTREWTAGLPVSGDGKLVVSKSLLGVRDWSTARGRAIFSCVDCTLGDDRTNLDVKIFDDAGMPFSHLTLDTVSARADFADGRMVLTAQWRSPEFELDAHVTAVLAKTPHDSVVSGCVKFRPTERLLERDPRLFALSSITGAPLDDAGVYSIRLEGPYGRIRLLGRDCQL